jgi:hypothetical protein
MISTMNYISKHPTDGLDLTGSHSQMKGEGRNTLSGVRFSGVKFAASDVTADVRRCSMKRSSRIDILRKILNRNGRDGQGM